MDKERSIVTVLKLRGSNLFRVHPDQQKPLGFRLVVVLGADRYMLSVQIRLLRNGAQMSGGEGGALGRCDARARGQHLIETRTPLFGLDAHGSTSSPIGAGSTAVR